MEAHCPECEEKEKHWYKNKLFIISAVLTLFALFSYFIQPLQKLFFAFIDYSALIWWAILLGLLIGGIIDYFIPRKYISKYLARKKKRTILYAVIFGFIASACSHGILAIAIGLYRKGASIPATVAFLLASPWANLPVTILLFGFFGAKALLFVFSAIIVAIITGLVFQLLENRRLIEKEKFVAEVEEGFSIRKDVKRRMKVHEFTLSNSIKQVKGVLARAWSLSTMVLWWILIGVFMASFARAFIPHEIFMNYLGATVAGLIITLIIATIIEVCSEGSAPIAFEIFNQTGAFGNSFVFLMSGVATDCTEIGLLWHNIGKRTALFIPLITVPQVLVLGYLFNLFL